MEDKRKQPKMAEDSSTATAKDDWCTSGMHERNMWGMHDCVHESANQSVDKSALLNVAR